MIELKPGNGGYGLEAYDTETGKYADSVSVSFKDENGNSYDNLKNFKDFLKVIGGQQMVDLYDEDEEFRKMIHDYQGDDGFWQVWEKMLRAEVDNTNRREELAKQREILYETSMDVANNAHNFFTREVIDDIINHSGYRFNSLNYNKDGSSYGGANLIAEKFREARYGSERMIPISQKELEQKCGPYSQRFEFSDSWSESNNYFEAKERLEEIKKNGYHIPIYRGIGCETVQEDKIAITSFFKKDFNPSESVAFTGSGYYDSVIYMSISARYAEDYSQTGLLVKACVDPNNLKIADLDSAHIGTAQMENFMNNDYKIFVKNLEAKMLKDGYSNSETKQFCEKIEEQCSRTSWGRPNNLGFVAMLFGYDAILGQAGQLDILNMKKAYVVDEGWGL